ncbi:MvdC/MvdD family ATP grasp protein [Deinococcus sp. YIM 77859]|uniref:MvdC/MvdD family ATP grasp protein n=1 Tax=Deinococcus sp. YIM 77859 TaxID=1540221 RepID=UPI000691EFA2|nr:hypothetical protein [Deinococcus sp. YIM 77859]
MEKIILLVTHKRAFEADLIVKLAREKGLPLVRLNQDDYPTRISIDLHFGGEQAGAFFRLPRRTFHSAQVAVAWYQQGYRPVLPERAGPGERLAQSETDAFLRGLWRVLDWPWLNSPERVQGANKLYQLRCAQRQGLGIPGTLVSTAEQAIRDFHAANTGHTIFKTMGTQFLDMQDQTLAAYTHPVDERVLTHLGQASAAPTLFQQQVVKAFEVRSVVVGNAIFSARIESQADASTGVDWRKNPELTQQHLKPYDLPPDIAVKVRALMRDLRLGFGAVDFIVTPQGHHVFLEVNPTGSWNWTQRGTGHPIGDTLLKALAEYL